MSTSQNISLGVRWRCSKRLTWRSGMRWLLLSPSGVYHRAGRVGFDDHPNLIDKENHPAFCIPDLSDVATAGCLVADARARHDDPRLYVMLSNDGHAIVVPGRRSIDSLVSVTFESEIEALLAALEANRA